MGLRKQCQSYKIRKATVFYNIFSVSDDRLFSMFNVTEVWTQGNFTKYETGSRKIVIDAVSTMLALWKYTKAPQKEQESGG